MLLINATISAAVNLVLLVGIPLTVYYVFHRRRHQRNFAEVARRSGLQVGELRHIAYCAGLAAVLFGVILLWPPALEPMTRKGSAWTSFVGLGLTSQAVGMALLYGVIKTGFAEEFLFRGLIAGSLARRLGTKWGNLVHALIFLLPHLLLLTIMPELWPLLVIIFVFSLLMGYVRIKSESIVGPWIVHASVNIAMGLSVAVRSTA